MKGAERRARGADDVLATTTPCTPPLRPAPLNEKAALVARPRLSSMSMFLRKRKWGNVVRSRKRDLDHLQLRHRLLVARGLVVTLHFALVHALVRRPLLAVEYPHRASFPTAAGFTGVRPNSS